MSWLKILEEGLYRKNIALDPMQREQFVIFTKELLAANRRMNLTAVEREEEIATKHYLDSLALLGLGIIKPGDKVIDIGSGAGFPGIPLAIMRPDIQVLMLDATQKKVGFIHAAVEKLELPNARALCGRAEELANGEAFRETFDIATSRAVANLRALSELSLGFVKPGGHFLALKGQKAEEELREAKTAIAKMGGKWTNNIPSDILEDKFTHSIIVIRKIAKTPSGYPRSYAKLLKNPL